MNGFRSDSCVALGGNLPFGEMNPSMTLVSAVERLANRGVMIRAVSRFFATPCFPAGAGPDFVNAVILIESKFPAEGLLNQLHAVENDFRRERRDRWGARTVDLDLLFMGQNVAPDVESHQVWRELPLEMQQKNAPEQLILPHPRMQDRAFVLVPMMDLCPDWRHPILEATVREMVADLPEADRAAVRPL